MSVLDLFKKLTVDKGNHPGIPLNSQDLQKRYDTVAGIISDVEASGFFKSEKLPELSQMINGMVQIGYWV